MNDETYKYNLECGKLVSFREIVANRPKRETVQVDLTNVPEYEQIDFLRNRVVKGTATPDEKIWLIILEAIAKQEYSGCCEFLREQMVTANIIPEYFTLEEFTLKEFGVGIELLAEIAFPKTFANSIMLLHRDLEKVYEKLTLQKHNIITEASDAIPFVKKLNSKKNK